MRKALAIDIGGTKIYNTIVNENGEIIGEIEKQPTPKTFEDIKAAFKNIIAKHENEVDIIAISTCGAVNNTNDGILGSTGNIAKGYPDMDFKSLSAKKVFVENDANAAAWAEHIIGASKGMADSIMITLGTGVGGGIIINNRIFKGKSGAAGEMHFKLRTDRHRTCTCGSYDCFEAYASGPGLKRTAEEFSNNPEITTYDVVDGWKNNDPLMVKIMTKWQDDILAGLIGLANLFDPEVIVLSGSMGEFVNTDFLTKELNKEIITSPTKVVKAQTGNYSGMIGAALLAMGVGLDGGCNG